MPRTSVASAVLCTTATAQDVWKVIRKLNFQDPPLSSCSIGSKIAWSDDSGENGASQHRNKLLEELSEVANPNTSQSGTAPSRYLATKLGIRQSARQFRVSWVERERSHRDFMEDVRAFKKQASRHNEIVVLPISTPGVSTDGKQQLNRIFVQWTSSSSIFTSDFGSIPYNSCLTTGPQERVDEMQFGLSQLRKMFDANVTLAPPQVEALLIEQHNAGPDSRFLCSNGVGGSAARKLFEGEYWAVCDGSPTAQAILAHARQQFPSALQAAIAASEATEQKSKTHNSIFGGAIDSCLEGVLEEILSKVDDSKLAPEQREAQHENELAALAVGIAALDAYVQANFTGPRLRDLDESQKQASFLHQFVGVVEAEFSGAIAKSSSAQTTVDNKSTPDASTRSPYDYPAEANIDAYRAKKRTLTNSVTRSVWLDYLNIDGEIVYQGVLHPELLCLASAILRALSRRAASRASAISLWSAPWWLMRTTAIWQSAIEDSHSQTLWDIQTRCFQQLRERGCVGGNSNATHESASEHRGAWWDALEMPTSLGITANSLRALAFQERAVALSQIENYHEARQCIESAGAALGVKIVVTGAQGRGTKFQTFDTPQLVAVLRNYDSSSDEEDDDEDATTQSGASQAAANSTNSTDGGINMEQKRRIARYLHGERTRDEREAAGVRTVSIESVDPYSHLMDQPILSERRAAEQVNRTVPAIAQAMMLAECKYVQGSSAIDATVQSQMKTFLSQTVRHPQSWAIQTMALYEKSLLELAVSRMPERALLQLQELVDQHTRYLRPQISSSHVTGKCFQSFTVNIIRDFCLCGAVSSILPCSITLSTPPRFPRQPGSSCCTHWTFNLTGASNGMSEWSI